MQRSVTLAWLRIVPRSAVILAALAAAACRTPLAGTPAKVRSASPAAVSPAGGGAGEANTQAYMQTVLRHHRDVLKLNLAAEPTGKASWEDLAEHAANLHQASFKLMLDPRAEDESWSSSASVTLREGSAALLHAVKAHDIAAARLAYASVARSCSTCHRECDA